MNENQFSRLSPFLKYFIATGCGIVVANLYYCQPLLGALARFFDISEEAASLVNICTQAGYGLGLFFIVPLGDKLERRKLLIILHLMAAASLLGFCISGTTSALYFFSVCIGITSTACQVFIPLAAHLAADNERGMVLGTVMGGLLSGILLSRTLSGFIAGLWGWQTVYFIAAGFMLAMAALIARYLPKERPAFHGSYVSLIRSLFGLFRQQPVIRQSAWIGACLFGSISTFWATMAFYLEKEPFGYSLFTIGLFGVIGAGGAFLSPAIGRLTDRKGPYLPMRGGIFFMLSGWLLLLAGQYGIALLIMGIFLIDLGMQATHIPNLARNYALLPEARTRLNTLYMTSFFLGGTIGSSLGSIAWNTGGWNAVGATGLLLVLMAAIPVMRLRRL